MCSNGTAPLRGARGQPVLLKNRPLGAACQRLVPARLHSCTFLASSASAAAPTMADLNPLDILVAARRLRGLIQRTALVRSTELSRVAGGDVYLKCEHEQITGSFKIRGALNVIGSLTAEERTRGVVAASAGNHGLGVA